MEFNKLTCPIPRLHRFPDRPPEVSPCGSYLADLDVNAVGTIRFTCRQRHEAGHSCCVEITQDATGSVTFREIPEEEHKAPDKYKYDNGVRFPAVVESVEG